MHPEVRRDALALNWFGAQREAEIARRFGTRPQRSGSDAGGVRIGFVFGPRALQRFCGRPVPVVTATGRGTQRSALRRFRAPSDIARFLVTEVNRSFARAGVTARVSVGAVGQLDHEEIRPYGPHPDMWLTDLCDGRVATAGGALPVECWCAGAGVNCALVLVDWAMSRTGIERGGWAGFAARSAERSRDGLRFWPVAIADLRCALTAHAAAHELGHVLGCSHDDAPNALSAHARGYARRGEQILTVMASAQRKERDRRLEWSRPATDGSAWALGDAEHDEAAWLRSAMPQLARHRFRCSGECGGACAELATI